MKIARAEGARKNVRFVDLCLYEDTHFTLSFAGLPVYFPPSKHSCKVGIHHFLGRQPRSRRDLLVNQPILRLWEVEYCNDTSSKYSNLLRNVSEPKIAPNARTNAFCALPMKEDFIIRERWRRERRKIGAFTVFIRKNVQTIPNPTQIRKNMQSRSSFVLKWSPKFSTTQTLTSHFVAHSFISCISPALEGQRRKIWFCYDECWLDFIFPRKTLKTSRKLELSYTHELPSVCFWRISSSAYQLAFRERRTRERRKVDFLVCKYNCQRTTALPKSGKNVWFHPKFVPRRGQKLRTDHTQRLIFSCPFFITSA